MVHWIRCVLGLFLALFVMIAPLTYHSVRHSQYKNFKVVKDGVLFRSGQLTPNGLKDLIHDFGIKTVVSLRDAESPADLPPDFWEEQYCFQEAIPYYRISPRSWWSPDGSVPAERGVNLFLHLIDNPRNHPILIHCYRGVHRTGAFCAIYRMEYEAWSNQRAIQELRDCGYVDLEDEWDLLGYLETYIPRKLRGPNDHLKPILPSSSRFPKIW